MRASCKIVVLTSLAVAAIGLGSPASAHHSFAMFDQTKSVTVQGTVRDFIWSNPHVFIQVMAAGEQGAPEEWSIEMSSPEHLSRIGWKHGTLKAGDKVSITIHPTRDGVKGGQYLSGMGPNAPLPGSKAAG
jgi:hypothetical protein